MLLRLAVIVAVVMQGLIGPVGACADALCEGAGKAPGAQASERGSLSACCGESAASVQQPWRADAGCCCCEIAPCREPSAPSAPPSAPRERSERDREIMPFAPVDAILGAMFEAPQAPPSAAAFRSPALPCSVRARLSLLCVRTT